MTEAEFWILETERLKLLSEVEAEQQQTSAPSIHNPLDVFRQLARTAPSPLSHRKAYRRITIDESGQIQTAKPPKPKPEGTPAEPEDKRPRGELKPPEPTAASLAIARYLARPKGTPNGAPVNRTRKISPEARSPRTTRSPHLTICKTQPGGA